MSIQLVCLPAMDGDCFVLKYGEENKRKNIIIDGGRGRKGATRLKHEIGIIEQKNEFINLLILTHVDQDHIQGLISLFKDKTVNKKVFLKIWFNSGRVLSKFFNTFIEPMRDILIEVNESSKISISQGIAFEDIIEIMGVNNKDIIISTQKFEIEDAIITILSPNISTLREFNEKWEAEVGETKIGYSSDNNDELNIEELALKNFIEDDKLPNRTSIAFLFEYNDKKIMMLGDSHPSILLNSLIHLGYNKNNKLKLDLVKISHHGSKYNTSLEFLEMLECSNFLISTNGSHNFPDKECLARIIHSSDKKTKLYFNYFHKRNIFNDEDYKTYDFECIFLNNENYDYILEV